MDFGGREFIIEVRQGGNANSGRGGVEELALGEYDNAAAL